MRTATDREKLLICAGIELERMEAEGYVVGTENPFHISDRGRAVVEGFTPDPVELFKIVGSDAHIQALGYRRIIPS